MGAAQLLPGVLLHLVRRARGAVALGEERRRAAYDLRDRGDVLHVLRRVPVLPGRRTPLPVRPAAQRRHRRVPGPRAPLPPRHGRLAGPPVPVVARCGLRGRDWDGVLLFTASRVDAGAVHRRLDPGRRVRAIPLRGGCVERAVARGRGTGGDAAPAHPRARARPRGLSGGCARDQCLSGGSAARPAGTDPLSCRRAATRRRGPGGTARPPLPSRPPGSNRLSGCHTPPSRDSGATDRGARPGSSPTKVFPPDWRPPPPPPPPLLQLTRLL